MKTKAKLNTSAITPTVLIFNKFCLPGYSSAIIPELDKVSPRREPVHEDGFKIQPGLQVSVIHKRGIADFFALGIGLQYRRSVHQFNYSARTWNRKIYPEDSCDILGFETTYKGAAHMDIHFM